MSALDFDLSELSPEELRMLEIHAEMAGLSGADVAQFFGDGFHTGRPGGVEKLDPKLVNAAYWRKWRAANPERARAYVAAYMAREPEIKKAMAYARKKRHRQRNREAYNAAQRAAYARRVAARKAAS